MTGASPTTRRRRSDLFSSSYTEARRRFLEAASDAGARVTTFENARARGPSGERLFTDVAAIDEHEDRAVVLVSGTHGIEGFAGSAAQLQLLTEGRDALPPNTALVLVHALNPYGFAHERRVNEDNVDINRNFVDHADPPHNPDYELVHAALLPDDWDGESRKQADAAIGALTRDRGIRFVQTAVTHGQYMHDDGLFYGGTGPIWSNTTWRGIVRSHLQSFSRIAYIDLHTGLGEPGNGEPIFRGGRDAAALDRARGWYGDALTLSEDGTSSSTPIIGNTASALADELPNTTELTAITLEFGTEPGIMVLNALRADNWLYHRGLVGGTLASEIKHLMANAFRPDDLGWRDDVMAEAERFITAACRGIGGTPPA